LHSTDLSFPFRFSFFSAPPSPLLNTDQFLAAERFKLNVYTAAKNVNFKGCAPCRCGFRRKEGQKQVRSKYSTPAHSTFSFVFSFSSSTGKTLKWKLASSRR